MLWHLMLTDASFTYEKSLLGPWDADVDVMVRSSAPKKDFKWHLSGLKNLRQTMAERPADSTVKCSIVGFLERQRLFVLHVSPQKRHIVWKMSTVTSWEGRGCPRTWSEGNFPSVGFHSLFDSSVASFGGFQRGNQPVCWCRLWEDEPGKSLSLGSGTESHGKLHQGHTAASVFCLLVITSLEQEGERTVRKPQKKKKKCCSGSKSSSSWQIPPVCDEAASRPKSKLK